MLEIAYYANSIEDIQNKVIQINLLLAKAKVIDFLLEVAVDVDCLTKKQYIKLANRLGDIEKFSNNNNYNNTNGVCHVDSLKTVC